MAAEEIKSILSGRKMDEQERILRWVTESLGLTSRLPSTTSMVLPATAPVTLAHPGAQHSHASPITTRPKDIKAFVEEKKPRSDLQFAAVVGYYHRFEVSEDLRKETITAQDLQDGARLAGWHRFPTPSVPMNNAVNQGYFDRAERGEFKLNAVGENLVAMALPGTGEDETDVRYSRRKPGRRKPKTIRSNTAKQSSR